MATFGYTSNGVDAYVSDNDISGTQYQLNESGHIVNLSALLRTTGRDTSAIGAIYDSSNNFIEKTRFKTTGTKRRRCGA